MISLVPKEQLQKLTGKYPCRLNQIKELTTFINPILPSPPTLVAYGLDQTDKLEVIENILKTQSIRYTIIKCKDCLSQRHLLSKIFGACLNVLGRENDIEDYDKIDNINSLFTGLSKLFVDELKRFVIVIDGIDKKRASGSTLLPSLARLGDQIPHISVIFTSSISRPLPIHKKGVPYIHFAPYSRSEAIYLITNSPPSLYPTSLPVTDRQIDSELLRKIYSQFVAIVYDSLISNTASTSLSTFRSTCTTLWPEFIWPYISQTFNGSSNTWDFSKLLVRNRSLFQTNGERILLSKLNNESKLRTFEDLLKEHDVNASQNTNPNATRSTTPQPMTQSQNFQSQSTALLKHFSSLILLSSYLASHTAPKHDIVLFSRLSSSSSSKRIRKSPQKKRSSQSVSKDNTDGTPSSKPARAMFETKLNIARPFTLERLTAIIRAIHPDGVSNQRILGDRIYKELGELERLGIVVRTAGAGEDPEERWKINVSRDWVERTGKSWGMGLMEYEMESTD